MNWKIASSSDRPPAVCEGSHEATAYSSEIISEIASPPDHTYHLPNWEVAAMRIIALSTLRVFWESHPAYSDAKTPLVELYRHMEKAEYQTPQALKAELRTASILKRGRVVFNVGGNKYRVIDGDRLPATAWVHTLRGDSRAVRSDQCGDRVMNIKPIHTQEDLTAALARVEQIWGADIGSPEGDELEILAILIEKYEAEHFPMPPSDPVEAIKFRMEQLGMTARDLEPFIGTSGRVSEVLNHKRKLSLSMIKRLHEGLQIPYERLLAGV